jgi:uncharacterized caspase-like protein
MSRKLALIIGNNNYSNQPLRNCVNDATCLANVLRLVENCQVELQTNLESEEMYECIRNFTASIKKDDFIVFFFAGHGVQWGDQNFLLPCDNNKITNGDDIQNYGINAQLTVNSMAEKSPHIVLFLLDCCRSYSIPSKTSGDTGPDQQVGGLNKMTAPHQTLIAFACAAGEVVSDQSETSTNGLFTKYLLKHINTPNEHIETVLQKVANDVAAEINSSQIPFQTSSIIAKEIYLVRSGKHIFLTQLFE